MLLGIKYLFYSKAIMDLPKVVKQHDIDDEAKRIFRNYFNNKNGFLVQELPKDYGIDYLVELIDNQGQTSGICFNVQLKGTKNIKVKDNYVTLSLKKTTLNLFSRQLSPTIIVLINVSNEKGYWHNSFDFINELDKKNPFWRSAPEETATIYLPETQDLSSEELIKLKKYVENVHTRRSSVPQGRIDLIQTSKNDSTLSIEDLSNIVDACDYNKFFEVISCNPFYYLSDVTFSILLDLFEKIPPKTIYDNFTSMAILSIALFKKGYHQESRKWGNMSLKGNINDDELSIQIELILNEIDFMNGYISQNVYLKKLNKMSHGASPKTKVNIIIHENRIAFREEEKIARGYGRFRSMEVIKNSIEQLRSLLQANKNSPDLVLLELTFFYMMLVPHLWGEIQITQLFRLKMGLQFPEEEINKMRNEAQQETDKANDVFRQLIEASNHIQISLNIRAEALLIYSQYIYQLHMNSYKWLVFVKDTVGQLPTEIPITEEGKQEIEKALRHCQAAKDLFKTIGCKDRETHALVLILGFLEDLKKSTQYSETQNGIEELFKEVWVPNTVRLYKEIVRDGSFRTKLIKDLSSFKKGSVLDSANMSDIEIEEQVECNSKTLNISDPQRIDNLRKDMISNTLAAKFNVDICNHFDLLQDLSHAKSIETIYIEDPNRIGNCKLLNVRSQFEHNDANVVIDSFYKTYCKNCNHREPFIDN